MRCWFLCFSCLLSLTRVCLYKYPRESSGLLVESLEKLKLLNYYFITYLVELNVLRSLSHSLRHVHKNLFMIYKYKHTKDISNMSKRLETSTVWLRSHVKLFLCRSWFDSLRNILIALSLSPFLFQWNFLLLLF